MEKLKVFEAFSGVGSQNMALRDLGLSYEVIATSEIDQHAIISYAAIHNQLKENIDYELDNIEEEREYLNSLGIFNIPRNKKRIHECYIASKLSKNIGDISKLSVDKIPTADLFTYSFPCQDISLAGHQKGLTKASGTRSSLLWECEKIIETTKPKFLLLENVKNLVSPRHKGNFNLWLNWLTTQGYENYWKIIDSSYHETIQKRERVFVVSILKESKNKDFKFESGTKLIEGLETIIEDNIESKFYYTESRLKSIKELILLKDGELITEQKEIFGPLISYCPSTLEYSGFKSISPTIMARDYKDPKTIFTKDRELRKSTPLENWRLMGFKDEDFIKAKEFNSNTQLYKQAGNSIPRKVLMSIFRSLLVEN